MRIIIGIVLILSIGKTLACSEPHLTVTNSFYGVSKTVIFFKPQNTDSDQGYVIADVSIDKEGRIKDTKIIEVEPAGLDIEVIAKHLRKAKFSSSSNNSIKRLKFEFTILQTNS